MHQSDRRSSERRQAEKALREGEADFRALAESMPQIVWACRPDGANYYFNRQWVDYTGLTLEESYGSGWKKPFHPEDQQRAWEAWQNATRNYVPCSIECRLRRADGIYRWWLIRGTPLRDASGTVLKWFGTCTDIEELKETQAALEDQARLLRESNDLLSNLARLVPGVVYQYRLYPDGRSAFPYSSPGMEDIYEVTPEEVREDATPVFGRLHPDDYNYVADAIAESARTLETFYCEFRVVLPRQGLRWRWSQAHPVRTADGGTLWHGIISDITERKQAEEALRASEATMRYIIKHDPNAIAVYDRDLRYIAVSDRYLTDYDIDGENIAGKHHYEVFPEIPQKWRDVHQRALAGAIERENDDSFVRLDGSLNYNNWECRPWYEPNGSIGGIITYTEVTTERKAAEAALRETEQQLRQSQKMEAVGQLAGGIAHDFNNLLTSVLGYSELLLCDPGFAATAWRDDVEEIRTAGQRASALTRQILAFSRRQALRPDVVSLNEVLNGTEAMLRRTLGEDVDFVALQHPDLGYAEIDVHQFEQVLMNLAINARDAMPTGGRLAIETANVELDEEYCRTHPEVTAGRYVMLSVSDTGVGMDQATLGHAFEPFFTTKAPGEGTGLGLAMVYGIVKQSRGNIFVYSEPGKGTTFKIYLPRVAMREAAEVVVLRGRVPSHGNETVLVVEDESSVRSLIERVLGASCYKVISFGSADEAMAAFGQGELAVDLVLTDVVLPGTMQGNDLARRMRDQRPDVPVLYMSGYTRDAIVHAGRLDEGVNFLEKPFTPEALAAAVRQVLDQAGTSG